MRPICHRLLEIAFLVLLSSATFAQSPVGTAFTYQGQLKEADLPANGSYDLSFSLWDATTGGTQCGSAVARPGVQVADGLFTVELDFGANCFATNEARWVEVRVNGTVLIPRQRLSATPFSLATRGLNVTDTGNVGIGISNPVTKLNVSAVALPQSTGTSVGGIAVASPFSPTGSYSAIDFVGWSSLSLPTARIAAHHSNAGSRLSFGTSNAFTSGITNEAMTIDPSGNVGIGVTSPQHRLTIGSPTADGQLVTLRVNGPAGFWNAAIGSSEACLMVGAAPGVALITGAPANLGGVVSLSLQPNGGNVGIGTTDPRSTLSVNGNAYFSGRLGIGDPTPDVQLVVSGTASMTGFRLTTGNPAAGKVLTATNTAGLGAWQDPVVSAGGIGGLREFTVSGTFVVPPGVSKILVEAWGGGGGGHDSEWGWGGGSGGYIRSALDVTPEETLIVAIGVGGAVAAPGGSTQVRRGGAPIVSANGGQPGQLDEGGAGGTVSGPPGIARNGFAGDYFELVQPPFRGRLESDEFGFASRGFGGEYLNAGGPGYLLIQW